jgi:hypothetical protein
MTAFLNDLRQVTIQRLTTAGVQFDANGTLRDLLHAYYTVEERRITPEVRFVHRAPEFDAAVAALDQTCQDAVVGIERKLSAGEDVNGHLSLRSLQPNNTDGLLIDWGIHHMHLSLRPHGMDTRFLDRTGPIALSHITAHDAYLLTVLNHGSWTDRSIITILVRRFPEAVESFEMRGVLPDLSVTDEIIKACRALGVVYVIAVDGKSYRPPSFAGSANLSERAYQRTEHAIRQVETLEKAVLANVPKIQAETPALNTVSSPDFTLFDGVDEWLVQERTTGQVIRICYN